MKPDPKRIRELFVATVGKVDPQQWEAFLEDECGGDEELLVEVRLLLDAHREAGSFLKGPAVDLAAMGDSRTSPAPEARSAEAAAPEISGTVIGPYKLLQQIGEGGMGTVYMAEQTAAGAADGRAQAHQGRHGLAGRSSPASRPSARRWP